MDGTATTDTDAGDTIAVHRPYAFSSMQIIESAHWDGRMIAAGQHDFPMLLDDACVRGAGVYIGYRDGLAVYIGQADPLADRLARHFRRQDWRACIVITADADHILHRGRISWIERALIDIADRHPLIRADNTQRPQPVTLGADDHVFCVHFLDGMLDILSVLRPELAVSHLDRRSLHSATHSHNALV